MMEMNVEIELGWIDGNPGEEIKELLEKALIEKVTESLSEDITKKISERADRIVTAKVDMLINSILEKPITITRGWSEKTEYASTFDMVETRMSQLYGERMHVSDSNCSKDPYLSKVEAYVNTRSKEMLSAIEKKIKQHGDKIAKEAVNNHALIKAIGATVKTEIKNGRKIDFATIEKGNEI